MKHLLSNILFHCMQLGSRMFPVRLLPKSYLKLCLMFLFAYHQGYRFDVDHPTSFNEKLQWYLLNYSDERMPECVDKLAFKSYVKSRTGRDLSPKTLGVWTDLDALARDWASLPRQFCLKSNCMAQNVGVIVITDKASVRFDTIRPQVRKWLKKRYTAVNTMHRGYRSVTPRIFAEEYVGRDASLVDYKFYCFDGKPYCSNATTRVFRDGAILDAGIAYYDNDWNVLEGNVAGRPRRVVEKPACLDEMLDIAARLSSGFPFLRVDLFCVGERVYTGEVEFFPGGGFGKYEPFAFDLELGEQFVLPRVK